MRPSAEVTALAGGPLVQCGPITDQTGLSPVPTSLMGESQPRHLPHVHGSIKKLPDESQNACGKWGALGVPDASITTAEFAETESAVQVPYSMTDPWSIHSYAGSVGSSVTLVAGPMADTLRTDAVNEQ